MCVNVAYILTLMQVSELKGRASYNVTHAHVPPSLLKPEVVASKCLNHAAASAPACESGHNVATSAATDQVSSSQRAGSAFSCRNETVNLKHVVQPRADSC